jgi:hypothetical protein
MIFYGFQNLMEYDGKVYSWHYFKYDMNVFIGESRD